MLLLDEPCSALDPISTTVIEDLLAGLKARTTIVIVTHNLAQARRLSDRLAVFWIADGAGYLAEAGNTVKLFSGACGEISSRYLAGLSG